MNIPDFSETFFEFLSIKYSLSFGIVVHCLYCVEI